MQNIRFFKVYNSHEEDNTNKVLGFQDLESNFSELRYFQWHGYQSKSLLIKFSPWNLVRLDMPCSNIEQLWNGVQVYQSFCCCF